eukprot:3654162-Pyramimonas_sp.AAC.2
MTCSDEFIAPSGYLDEEYMCQKWPTLRDALSRGLEWQVLNYAVAQEFPDVLRIGVSALNRKD